MKYCPPMLIACVLALLTHQVCAERAWIRFDPARPGYDSTPSDEQGWSAIQGLSLLPGHTTNDVAHMQVLRHLDKATPLLLQDLSTGTHFRRIELALTGDPGTNGSPSTFTRIILESARLVDHTGQGAVGSSAEPREEWTIAFGAVTYIYERPDEEDATYSQTDLATGAGNAGAYTPRDSESPPTILTRLARDPADPSRFALTWNSEPGVGYVVEYTRDLLHEPFQPIVVPMRITDDGRKGEIPVLDPTGFYRIREQ